MLPSHRASPHRARKGPSGPASRQRPRSQLPGWARALAVTALMATAPAWAGQVAAFSGYLSDPANRALHASDLGAAQFGDDTAIANNVALYALHVDTAGPVRFTSTGFAAGGVDPYFSLFSGALAGSATWLVSNYLQAFSSGGDFVNSGWLDVGDYTVAIGAFANMSLAENRGGFLADGFSGLGESYLLGSGFYSISVEQSDGGGGTVPEPASGALVLSAMFCGSRRARSLSAFNRRTMMKMPQALLVALSLAVCALFADSAQAQTRAALVQNVDEPGRTPYSELKSANCFGSQLCRLLFSAVPAGKRLVLTNINGYTHVTSGTLPDIAVVSWTATPTPTQVSMTATRGATFSAGGTRMYVNQTVLAFFGPGDVPLAAFDLRDTSDTLAGNTQLQLTGYYISLP